MCLYACVCVRVYTCVYVCMCVHMGVYKCVELAATNIYFILHIDGLG